MPEVMIFPDSEALARAAADVFILRAKEAIGLRDQFSVALSGGSTPQAMFKLLATDSYARQVDWPKVHVFWGDERCVPPENPQSNFGNANELLLSKVSIPQENIHRIPGEEEPERAAEDYEETLLAYFTSLPDKADRARASFDLALLGMGDDGHTASLFPGTRAIHEETRWVMAHYVDKLAAWRVTLTPALLDRAAHVVFLVSGQGKADTLQHVIYGAYQPDRYPAQVIRPNDGALVWMIDEAAAALF